MFSPHNDQHAAYTHSVPSLASSVSSPLPGPAHSSIAYIEMGVRLQRLEQDYLEMHRRLTEHGIRLDALQTDKTPTTTTGDGEDSRATLKRLVLESVSATHSLRDGEPPGYDVIRKEGDFPNLKFFTERQWNKYKRDNPKTTRIGEEPVRGRKMSAQGINHTAPYVEYPDGTPAEGDYINDARKFCRTLINLARGVQYPLPKKWGDTDTWLQELFLTALRKKFPLFQLCHNNSKGHAFMYYTYYEAVTRKWDKASSQNVDLNQALHTISAGSDLEESESESARRRDVRRTGPSEKSTSVKRPSVDDDVVAGPRKQARTDPGVPRQIVEAPPAPSKAWKGKERAAPRLLSVIAPATSITAPPDLSPLHRL
ncbi:hypothetical protein DICSQDRAFT_175722 [Dichomitus squalens LYAD-421 SS1]|uniref:Uncharacterized protein n=1 Tax=Dichomitus squalens (strain LYAD-421) TaxID=732165 RepID=R7SHF4_DICSQ|nr:uncharacterized protein DICSQDRAFT_175722 [Dichomitus squalens LYAD-421 SS1]EJF55591.1 hypothetical protein DICSQDRAFT_175722 [Dichomitus squalens LYAD-421 SS1]